jgi:hypothetical protein
LLSKKILKSFIKLFIKYIGEFMNEYEEDILDIEFYEEEEEFDDAVEM